MAGTFRTETTGVVVGDGGQDLICPCCEQPVMFTVAVDTSLRAGPLEDTAVIVNVLPVITGLKIDHHCGTYAADTPEENQ